MGGIAGLVDFSRDLAVEGSRFRPMIDSLRHRGPDGCDWWVGRHVALGQARLAVGGLTSEPGVAVEMQDDTTTAVLVCSGAVDNLDELRSQLAAAGEPERAATGADLLLRAYLAWGEGFVQRLHGMFAIAVWDQRRRRVVLVRDRMGAEPLYWARTPAGVVFGSEPKAVLAGPFGERRLTIDGLRETFSSGKTPGHAVLEGLAELRPGHVLTVRAGAVDETAYWRLGASAHDDGPAATIATVRDMLAGIVAREAVADPPACALLSGGLDSSTITALARSAPGAGPFATYSVDFTGYSDNFGASHMRATPDGPFVRDVVQHCGTEHGVVELDSAQLLEPGIRDDVLQAMDLPMGMGDLSTSLYLLFRALSTTARVVLSGESADELFGGFTWFHDPAVLTADTFPWLAAASAREFPATDVFTPAVATRLDLAGYHHRRYREALDDVPTLEREGPVDRRMREVTYMALTRFAPILLDRRDRMSMASGVQVRVPFCDHRLVEYVFNVPWAMKSFDGHEKSLLRAAARDLLPRSVLARRKSHFPRIQDPTYDVALRAEFAALARRPDAPLMPALNPDLVAAAAAGDDRPFPGGRRVLEGLLELDRWLDRYDVALDL